MSILDKFLKFKGVKSPSDLDNSPNEDGSPTEQQVFEKWKVILGKEQLTIEDMKNFLTGQIALIEMRWKDLTLENAKKAELIPYHTVYKTLEAAISAPQAERERLEANLNQLIS